MVVSPRIWASMDESFPEKMPLKKFPRWSDGQIKSGFGFVSNGPPDLVGKCVLKDIYAIKNEGDYTLTVCPVLYRYGTNSDFLDRVDLPCVTTKIHLIP
jgi:hypothetical protein